MPRAPSGPDLRSLRVLTQRLAPSESAALRPEDEPQILRVVLDAEVGETADHIFLNMSFALKLYSRYITNFAAARECVARARGIARSRRRWRGDRASAAAA
mgnify:CR=1 FL=1